MLIKSKAAFATPVRHKPQTFTTHLTFTTPLLMILVRMTTQTFYIKIRNVLIPLTTTFFDSAFAFPLEFMLFESMLAETTIRTSYYFTKFSMNI